MHVKYDERNSEYAGRIGLQPRKSFVTKLYIERNKAYIKNTLMKPFAGHFGPWVTREFWALVVGPYMERQNGLLPLVG